MFDHIVAVTIVSVESIPDTCQHKLELQEFVQDPFIAVVTAVAVNGFTGIKAYIGYPDKQYLKPELQESNWVLMKVDNICSKEQIAALGNLLDKQTARTLFPSFFR